ncbi:MAG: ECF transporter S component [Ruminococcus sp.]|nr:ECF transporter S component [Ruminococcus sp.]
MTKTRKLVVTAMLSSIAAVLMLIEFPIPFIAPPFYKLDFSEIPALIGAFSMGPVAAITIEAVKVLVNFLLNGSSTGGVGEIANFLIGCSFVIPASIIYKYKKTKKQAIISMAIGTLSMAVLGVFINAYVMIPIYSQIMPLKQIIQMGMDIVPFITDTLTFCIFCVAPFNLIKGVLVSAVTGIIYKPLSRVIHPKN